MWLCSAILHTFFAIIDVQLLSCYSAIVAVQCNCNRMKDRVVKSFTFSGNFNCSIVCFFVVFVCLLQELSALRELP